MAGRVSSVAGAAGCGSAVARVDAVRRRTGGAARQVGTGIEVATARALGSARQGRNASTVVALRRHADVLIPLSVAVVLFAQLLTVALLRARGHAAGFDLAYHAQAAWLIAHGEPPFVTTRSAHVLGEHAYLLLYPIGWAARLVPPVPLLFTIQAAALALGAVAVYGFARRVAGLAVGVAAAVTVAYALHPVVHNINAFDARPEVVAVPALAGALLFGLTDRWWPYAACVALVLASRDDAALVVAPLGLLLIVEGRRRAGIATAVVAVAWYVALVTTIMPRFADGTLFNAYRLDRYGDSLGGAIVGMATHPRMVAGDLVNAQTVGVLIAVLAPVAFLAVLAPRFLLPALPLQIAYWLADHWPALTINFHYHATAIPFVLAATAIALAKLPRGEGAWRIPIVVVVAATASTVAVAHDSPLSAMARTWGLPDARDARIERALARVPDGEGVAATEWFLPGLAEREAVHIFPWPFIPRDDAPDDPVSLAERQANVRWILVERADMTPADTAVLHWLLARRQFGAVFGEEGIEVYRRIWPGPEEGTSLRTAAPARLIAEPSARAKTNRSMTR